MGKFKIAIVRRGQEARWREYWIASASKGTADDAPSGLGRTEVVEAATLAEAVEAVERVHPDCTVMLCRRGAPRRLAMYPALKEGAVRRASGLAEPGLWQAIIA